MSNSTVYQMVTEEVIRILESGLAPWRQPWTVDLSAPRNAATGYRYRGVNVFLLLAQGRGTPYWLTFRQVGQLGGRVGKGERGSVIVFWRMRQVREPDADGDLVERQIPLLRYYRVWNLEQATGVRLPAKTATEQQAAEATRPITDADRVAAAEQIIDGYRNPPTITADGGLRAYYRPSTDSIHLPRRSAFTTATEWYATAYHELGHSTGHPSRLNRSTANNHDGFASHSYGREELVAEMTAVTAASALSWLVARGRRRCADRRRGGVRRAPSHLRRRRVQRRSLRGCLPHWPPRSAGTPRRGRA
ncbi:MAG: ArdC family protein [Micromonosporaceae bacterium]